MSIHNSLYDTYAAVFADPAALKGAANRFSDPEYVRLVKRATKVNPDTLLYTAFDRFNDRSKVEKLIERAWPIKMEHIPFEYVSEEFYMRAAEKFCNSTFDSVRVSTKLPPAQYTKLANIAIRACPQRISDFDADLIESKVYNELAKIAIEYSYELAAVITPQNYAELIRTTAKRQPMVLLFAKCAIDDELLIDSIERDGNVIAMASDEIKRKYAKIAVENDSAALKHIPANLFTDEEYLDIINHCRSPFIGYADHGKIPDDVYDKWLSATLDTDGDAINFVDFNRFSASKHKKLILRALYRQPRAIRRLSNSADYVHFAFVAIATADVDVVADIDWNRIPVEWVKTLWLLAIHHNINCLRHFDAEAMSKRIPGFPEELYSHAAHISGATDSALVHIPRKYITPEIVAVAKGSALIEFMDEDSTIEACRLYRSNLRFAKAISHEKYEQLAIEAVRRDYRAIRYIKYPLCRAEAYSRLLDILDKAESRQSLRSLLRG